MLLSTETLRGRIVEINGETQQLANEIAERQLAQKRLADERTVLVEILRARGQSNGHLTHEHTVEPGPTTVKEAIIQVLKHASGPMQTHEILTELRKLGAGSERTNLKNVEWTIWKINDQAREDRRPQVVTVHGPHVYSIQQPPALLLTE